MPGGRYRGLSDPGGHNEHRESNLCLHQAGTVHCHEQHYRGNINDSV